MEIITSNFQYILRETWSFTCHKYLNIEFSAIRPLISDLGPYVYLPLSAAVSFEMVVECYTAPFKKKELSQDSVARLTYSLPLNVLTSMAHDLDLMVSQVRHDGTA